MSPTSPDPHGAATLAAAIAERFDPGAPRWWGKGVVTAVNGSTASVDVPGDTLEMASTGWYLPRVGDVVFCVGPPGQWLILGPVGSGTAAVQTGPSTVTGGSTTDDLNVTHDVTVGHEIRSTGGIRTEAGLSCGGAFAVGGGSTFSGDVDAGGVRIYANNLSIRGNSIWNYDRDGAIRWESAPNDGALSVVNRDGSAYRGIFASNFAPPPSWRAYKQDQRPLAEFLGATPGDAIDALDVAWSWTYDPDVVSFADGHERIGPRLDEVPDGLIVRSVDEDTGEDRSSWDLAGIVTVLVAEVQALRKRVAELER